MGFLEERDLSDVPTISEFYRGKTLFVTGGSGFMGMALIEKLLYSCGDIDKIYVLIRPKKGKTAQQRTLALYEEICFNRLRKKKPEIFKEKVVGIAGDVLQHNLGISDDDRQLLINKVNIFFHSAASVRFDDDLSTASKMNIRGTIRAIDLAKQMKNLVAYIHVSTCYTNTTKGHFLEEKLYPPHADWRETLEISEKMDMDTNNALLNKYLGDVPNTYAFTKQLAEHVISEERGLLPAIIIRPSVVVSAIEEPMPGWIYNFNGPVGLHIATGKGLISVVLADPNMKTDYIPVDICIKHFLAAAWIRGTKKLEATDDVEIYQCSDSSKEQFTLQAICDKALSLVYKNPINNVIKVPGITITPFKFWFVLQFILFQLSRAIFIDAMLWLTGQKPILIKIQRKIFKAQIALSYYTMSEWRFDNTNFNRLCECIKREDQEKFSYNYPDLRLISEKYYTNCINGAKLCLLKEKPSDLEHAKKHLFRVRLVTYLVKFMFYSFLIWTVWKSKYFQNTINSCGVLAYNTYVI